MLIQGLVIDKKALWDEWVHILKEYFQNEKDKYCSGATKKAINNASLKKIKIPVSPMEIQEKIVKVLDQALIDKRKKAIMNLL